MKKWIVKANHNQLTCDLITAYLSSSFRLKLKANDKEFMAEFKNRDEYLRGKDGHWATVKIYTLNKKTAMWGIAKFTEYYKRV